MLETKKAKAWRFKGGHFINRHKGSVGKRTAIRKEGPVDQIRNEGMEGGVEQRTPRARNTHAGTLT